MNINDYIVKKTSREKEDIEWTQTYTYNAKDNESPRVLLAGDSICNAYHRFVRDELSECVNVTFWASSKCVTDCNYIRELDYITDCSKFDEVTFNCGAHSLVTPLDEYEKSYSLALKFIKAKLPNAKLTVVLTTPVKKNEEQVKKLNQIAEKLAEENGCDVIDLYTPSLEYMKDGMRDDFHYETSAVQMQAHLIAQKVKEDIGNIKKGIQQKGTETGPLGRLE